MSLVNELLIEAERRRTGGRRRRPARIDDLIPTRSPASNSSRGAIVRGIGAVIVSIGISGALGWAYFDSSARRATPSAPARRSPPPVAARVEPRDDTRAPSPAHTTDLARDAKSAPTRRPVAVESILLERRDDATRIRIATDERTAHRIDHDPRLHRLELVLAGSSLAAPTDPFDLLDTPIRSVELSDDSPDLRLTFELDRDVHVQTRWIDQPRGAALVVDLQSPHAWPSRSREELPPVAAADSNEAPAALATELSSMQGIEELAEVAPRVSRPMLAADQVVSPSLGDPSALRIERSVGERERASRAASAAAFAAKLESARRLRTAGRFEEADTVYAELALVAPHDTALAVEWSNLKLDLGKPDAAFALVRGLRNVAPRSAELLVAEARLLERAGDLAAAIRLLDASDLGVTEAPSVHALAAAYHQRSGDHASAIARYEEILRRYPEEAPGWMGLGISFEAEGRESEARDVYRIALMVGELPTPARRWVADRLAALGEKD